MSAAVVELLRAGRERIVRGWTKGDYARAADGKPTGELSRHATCWCAMGALYNAAGDVNARLANNAIGCLADELPAGAGDVAEFNDADSTSHADVIALFDRAIAAAVQS